MAITTDSTTTQPAPFDNDTPTAQVTRLFKTTEENKERVATVSLSSRAYHKYNEKSLRSARWRSFGQLMNDALIYYLDGNSEDASIEEIIEKTNWSSEYQRTFAITPTLYQEIDALVNHPHTGWVTKQELYICALYTFIEAGYPIIKERR